MSDVEAFWEELYTTRASGKNIWSGKVNAPLAAAIEGFTPGRALDLGCGEGGDALHLASLGWQVTAVDVSPTALARTRAAADAAGLGDRVTTERHDLAETFPTGTFDLVVAMFFQSPLELPRERVLNRAASSLSVGGHLVLVEHGSAPSWSEHHDHQFPAPDELFASLDLDPSSFSALRVGSSTRDSVGPHGETGTLLDTVIVVQRVAG